jgi:hypothetical protein
MPIEYEVITSGTAGDKHYDVTVLFHTSKANDASIEALERAAETVLSKRKVHCDDSREIRLFRRGAKTILIFHYESAYGGFEPGVFKFVERDFKQTLPQVVALVELFEGAGE